MAIPWSWDLKLKRISIIYAKTMIFNLIFRELYIFSFLDLGAPLENSNQARSETFKNQQNVDQGVGTPHDII